MDNQRNRKVDELMGAFDGIQRATAPDFFYTRLKARMEKGLEPAVRKSWILRPAYAFSALLLVLVINAAVIIQSEKAPKTIDTETEALYSVSGEYNLNDFLTEEVYK